MEKKKLPSPYDYMKLGAYCAALVEAGVAANYKAAAELARKVIPPERKIQQQIMAFLRSKAHAFFWKDAAGPYQQQGIPDIVGVYNGAFYAFEVKRPLLGKLTPVQEETINKINHAGGAAFVVTGVEDVKHCLSAGLGPYDEEEC